MLSIQEDNYLSEELFINECVTKDGLQFNPNLNIWQFSDVSNNKKFVFSDLHIKEDKIYGIKRTLMWYLENNSMNHSSNMYRRFKYFCNYLYEQNNEQIIEISTLDLKNYKNSLNKKNMYYLGALSVFLKQWYKMGYPGLSKEAYEYLNEVRIIGNKKGLAVLTMDPYNGPFSDLERELIEDTLNNKYASNEILDSDFLLIRLMLTYGSRPIQFALLKISDLKTFQKQDKSSEYIISIPRVKNRKKARSEFKKRILPPEIGQLLIEYADDVKKQFRNILDDANQAPLFPSSSNKRTGELAYHPTSGEITDRIQSVISKFNLISERTEDELNITSTRFRRTFGSRAAAEGHGKLIIAEMLDHQDTQNVGIYVESQPEIIERIDKAIAIHMAPIAQAFAGKLVKDKSTAIRFDDPTSDIIDPKVDPSCKAMGKCGTYSFCSLYAPLACYTCNSFQAWVDGPHEKLLEYLINERERLLKTTDYRIASINDKTILAVAQVILECRKYKEENAQELIV